MKMNAKEGACGGKIGVRQRYKTYSNLEPSSALSYQSLTRKYKSQNKTSLKTSKGWGAYRHEQANI